MKNGSSRQPLSSAPPEQILETLPSGLFLVDLDRRITYWNLAAEQITGYSAEEVLGKHCSFLQGIPCGKGCGLYESDVPKPILGVSCSIKARDGRRIFLAKNFDYLRDRQERIIGGVESFVDITRRRALEIRLRQQTHRQEEIIRRRTAELEEERTRLRTVLDSMEDFAYICAPDYTITFLNKAMMKVFGPCSERTCYRVLFNRSSACPRCPMERVLQGETVRQERQMAINGRIYEVVHTPVASRDGSTQKLSVFRDVTERRRAEKKILAAKNRVEHLLHTSPAVIYTAAPAGNFTTTFIGQNIRDLLGYAPEEFLGTPDFWISHVHPEDRQRVAALFEGISPSERGVAEYRFLHGDGTYRWMRDEFRLISDADGHPMEFLGFWADITDHLEREEQLREVNRELDSFASTVSHDLRSPLTPIIGFAEYLEATYGEQLQEEGVQMLGEIRRQGARMLAIMEDLLQLARVGRLPPPAEPVPIASVVREVLDESSESLAESGLKIEVGPLPSASIPPTLLSEIFSNLLGNAIRYAARPGTSVEIGGSEEGGRIRLFARDHGPGIPEEERERIFESFYRGSTAGKVEGTGIGLATVRKIARLYGGHAWVEETPGGGATFWVEMNP